METAVDPSKVQQSLFVTVAAWTIKTHAATVTKRDCWTLEGSTAVSIRLLWLREVFGEVSANHRCMSTDFYRLTPQSVVIELDVTAIYFDAPAGRPKLLTARSSSVTSALL